MNTIQLNKEKSKDSRFYYDINIYGYNNDIECNYQIENEGEYLINIIDCVDNILTNHYSDTDTNTIKIHHLEIINNNQSVTISLDEFNCNVEGRDGEYIEGLDIAHKIMSDIFIKYCNEVIQDDYWHRDHTRFDNISYYTFDSYFIDIDIDIYKDNNFYTFFCESIMDKIGKSNFIDLMKRKRSLIDLY